MRRAFLPVPFLLAGLAALAAGCGAAAPPTHQLTASQAAIRGAEEVGAENTPKAALHLKMARDHLTNAENLISNEEYGDAALVLKRAEADANLAIALAKEDQERSRAQEAMRKVQELKRDIQQ